MSQKVAISPLSCLSQRVAINGRQRLEVMIGPSQTVFPTFHEPVSRRDIEATAESLSALRLHYEEVLVRLYFCQRNVSFMMRDPANRNEDGWSAVREGLAQARAAIETPARVSEIELWERLEKLVECSERDNVQSENDLNPGASSSLLNRGTWKSVWQFDRKSSMSHVLIMFGD